MELKRKPAIKIAELWEELSKSKRLKLFRSLSIPKASKLLAELADSHQRKLTQKLSDEEILPILKSLHPDDGADILNEIPSKRRRKLLKALPTKLSRDLEKLIRYPSETAGGLMTTEFISVKENWTVKKALQEIRQLAEKAETLHYIYATDREGKLLGVLPIKKLMSARSKQRVGTIMQRKLVSVSPRVDQEKVAKKARRHDLSAVPVVGSKKELLGIVTIDDLMDVILEEQSEDAHKLGGIVAEELELDRFIHAPLKDVLKARLPWLLIYFLGGLLAANLLGFFKSTLSASLVLVFFIPLIIGIGGSAGLQSSTVSVRGLATGQLREAKEAIFREFIFGLCIGASYGAFLSFLLALWKNPIFGIIVGFALFLTITIATTFGASVPIIFKKIGVDPALSSGPLITLFQDLIGLSIYFSIAFAFLSYLV